MKKQTNVSVSQATVAVPQFSTSALDQTPFNAFSFLRAAASEPIQRQLASVGYTQEDHTEGWMLFLRIGGLRLNPQPTKAHNQTRDAILAIESILPPNLQRARALLQRRYPDIYTFVFGDQMEVGSDQAAVLTASVFVDRLDALQNSLERKATRKTDHEALVALAKRGVTPAFRKQLASLLVQAQQQSALPAVEAPITASDRDAALTDLYLWLREWRATARTVITNRAQLLQLGIAKRRLRKMDPVTQSPITITPVAASPTPPSVVAAPQLAATSPTSTSSDGTNA